MGVAGTSHEGRYLHVVGRWVQKLDDSKLFSKILTRASGHTLIEITARGMVDEVLMKLVSHTEGALW